MEPQARVDTNKDKAFVMEGAEKPPTDKPNRKVEKGYDVDSSYRYLCFFSVFSSVYHLSIWWQNISLNPSETYAAINHFKKFKSQTEDTWLFLI